MLGSDLVIFAAYTVAALLLTSKGVIAPFLAVVICNAFSYSAIFDVSTAVQAHLFYVITNLILINFAQSKPVKLSMFAMVLLNIVMTVDAHYYADIKTWNYLHYATNTTIIHCFIIYSLFVGRRNILSNNLLYDRLRSLPNGSPSNSRDRQLSGSYSSEKNQKEAQR